MSRSSLSDRNYLLVLTTALALLVLAIVISPAESLATAVKAPGRSSESHGAITSGTGRLVAADTTADSDTYLLPNGHMLTRVFTAPVNEPGPNGIWQALPAAGT